MQVANVFDGRLEPGNDTHARAQRAGVDHIHHQVGVRLEQAEHVGPDAAVFRLVLTQIQVPVGEVVEVEKRLQPTACVQCILNQLGLGLDIELYCLGIPIENRQGAQRGLAGT